MLYLRGQLRSIPNRKSDEYRVCQQQIDALEMQLSDARKNAAEDVYNRNNSAGNMGFYNAENDEVTVDFHGLYLRDAIEKYRDIVLPTLPVQSKFAIITGKGKHSESGKSVLRDGLIDYIRRSAEAKSIDCEIDPKNSGRVLLRWITENENNATS